MKKYELIWEIFNSCSGNQMRDVHFQEVTTDDPEGYVRGRCIGHEITFEASVSPDGSLIYDFVTDGLKQRATFTEI